MKVSEMCVRKKQVRPGVYKTLCDGYIRMQAGVYHVSIGTIIVPENDLLIVKTKHGRVCWLYEPHRNWWIGRVLYDDFTVKKDNQYGATSQHASFVRKSMYDVIRVDSDGMLWVQQKDEKDEKLKSGCKMWIMTEAIRAMEA